MFKRILSVIGAACVAAAMASAPANAQDKMGKMDKMQTGKSSMTDKGKMKSGMMAGKDVYVCSDCKMYFSSADAKKMGYKDSMGHKLKKMAKAPAGYKMGHMDGMKMKGKM